MEHHYFRPCFLLLVLRRTFTWTDADLMPSGTNIAQTKIKIKHFSLQHINAFETGVSQIVAISFGTPCSPLKCVKIRLWLQAIHVHPSVCSNQFCNVLLCFAAWEQHIEPIILPTIETDFLTPRHHYFFSFTQHRKCTTCSLLYGGQNLM